MERSSQGGRRNIRQGFQNLVSFPFSVTFPLKIISNHPQQWEVNKNIHAKQRQYRISLPVVYVSRKYLHLSSSQDPALNILFPLCMPDQITHFILTVINTYSKSIPQQI